MFGSDRGQNNKLQTRRVSDMTSSMFTRNLYDMKYRPGGTGRDSYIYDTNGGFTCTNIP